jgi:hypothetical protein
MAAGTIILVTGMIICSAIIEKSTTEEKWVVREKPLMAGRNGTAGHQGDERVKGLEPAIKTTSKIEPKSSYSATSVTNCPETVYIEQATSHGPSKSGLPKTHLLWLQKRLEKPEQKAAIEAIWS